MKILQMWSEWTLFRYERPESISQDLKEKFGLVSDQEKLTNHYEAMSTGDGEYFTIFESARWYDPRWT